MTTYLTSGKIFRDPEPWRVVTGKHAGRYSALSMIPETHSVIRNDPRPEYDHHNPILVELRVNRRDIFELLQDLDWDNRWRFRFTPQEIKHARRVLELLVSIRKK